MLHELDGMSAAEIGDVVGAPVNTIYDRLRTARLRFAEAVRELRRNA